MNPRSLKIEEHDVGWRKKVKPKIRLVGRWLEQAGFKPGGRIHVSMLEPGVLELRTQDMHDAPNNSLKGKSLERQGEAEAEHPF